MDWLWLSFLLALGLAMDCVVLALSDGLSYRGITIRKIIFTAAVFGIFQGLFPLVGYLLGTTFAEYVDKYDHYISFALLLAIGLKMLYDGIKGTVSPLEISDKPFSYKTVLLQGVADSIDALAVGVSIGTTIRATQTYQIYVAFIIIAVVSFALSLVGLFAGKSIVKLLKGRYHLAEVLGGLILIALGTFILLEGIGVLG